MLPQGYVYAGYQILSSAFSGNYGVVYKALHQPTNREVALKFTKFPQDRHWYGRFKNENKFLHQLNPHDHVIKAYSNVTHDKTNAFYAMEFLEVGLENYLATIPSNEVTKRLELFKQICAGLKHAHSKKIYHRDLHAANIRMDADKAKLVDFGLGKDGLNATNSSVGQIIWFGGAVTTPEAFFYVSDSPTHEEDVRKDVYALGVILYTIFASSNVAYTLSIRNSMLTYFLGHGLANYSDYLKLDTIDRKAHYDAWLQTLDPKLSDTLDISLPDFNVAKRISAIIKKACNADHNSRHTTVQGIVEDIEGL
jgi:serine/threonine protein kinase